MLKIKPIFIFLAIIVFIVGGFWLLGKGNTNPNTEGVTLDGGEGTPVSNTPNPDAVIAEKEKIDPADPNVKVNDELETVTFCGKSYKSKQIMVKNVDVVKRLAELASPEKTEMQKNLCFVADESQKDGTLIVEIKNMVHSPGDNMEPFKVIEGFYKLEFGPVNYGPFVFSIDIKQNLIGKAGFTGEEVGPLIK